VGWEKVACWCTKAAITLKRVKIEETLLWRAYRKSPTLFRFFRSPPYFYFRFRLYGHRDGRFCLMFARTARQSVLDGTNGLSSFKPCACCQIVHRADIFAIAKLFVLKQFTRLKFARPHRSLLDIEQLAASTTASTTRQLVLRQLRGREDHRSPSDDSSLDCATKNGKTEQREHGAAHHGVAHPSLTGYLALPVQNLTSYSCSVGPIFS